MITNGTEKPVSDRLSEARSNLSSAAPVLDAIARGGEPFALRLESPGVEFQAMAPIGPHANRAVLKVFKISEGPLEGRAAVFFYKKSRIPWSHDRHSYGVCLVPPSGPTPGEVEEWISFAATGFHPEHRPSRLRQAFTFTVPD